MQQAATRPMEVVAEEVAALFGFKVKPTSPLLLRVAEVVLPSQTTGFRITMAKMELPPTPAAVAEATMPLAMLLEERADKMDTGARAAVKVGFPLFKAPQANLQRPMAEMGAMAVAVAVVQAAAAIPCTPLVPEEAIQAAAPADQPIIMEAAAADPTTPAATPQAPAVSKVETGRLSLPIKLEWFSTYQPLPINFRMPL